MSTQTYELSRREKIVAGIDPETDRRMSAETWHRKLVMMTATFEEYAPYYESVKQAQPMPFV